MTIAENSRTDHLMSDVEADNPPLKMLEPLIVSGPKQGHSVCGCCCDTRRATIIVNILLLAWTIGEEPFTYFLYLTAQLDAFQPFSHTLATIALMVLSCLFNMAAILGALTFNAWLVIANTIYLAVSSVLAIVTKYQENGYYSIDDMIFTLFFIYPHIMLVYELKVSKTMSKQTYPRENHSCCCVPYRYHRSEDA